MDGFMRTVKVSLDRPAMDALRDIQAGIADLDADIDELSVQVAAQSLVLASAVTILAEIRDILKESTTTPGAATQVVLALGKPVPQALTL